MDWAWLAIGFGALIIVTRAPLIFRPPETMEFFRGIVATDARARVMGGLYLVLGLACFGATEEASGFARQLLFIFVVVFLAMAVWALATAAHFRSTIDRISRFAEERINAAVIRGLGILGVAVGALLVYVGVRAL